MILDLASRAGWPADLRILIDRYPREIWTGHQNLGETARFWLERHEFFRKLGGSLADATTEFREERLPAEKFRALFAPRLQMFLSHLEGHHQIEDLHYFPVFRAAEERLARGFDVLERDHEAIHRQIVAVVDAANGLLRAMEGHADAQRAATDHYAEAGAGLLKSLLRHLDDEEDLIVPVILEQGERRLFRS